MAIRIILIALFCAVAAFPQQKMRIAIMDVIPSSGISADVAVSVSELIRTEMFNTGLFRVVEREQMDKIMKESELQSSGCTDTECAVKLGKMLSVDRMMVGKISKLGGKFIINARIINIERAEMEFADKATVESEGDLDRGVAQFAQNIAARIKGTPVQSVNLKSTTTPGKTTPGGMQPNGMKSLMTISGISIFGAGVLCNGFGVFQQFVSAPGALTTYSNLTTGTEAEYTTAYNNYKGAYNLGSIMNIVGYSCYGVGATLFIISLLLPENVPVAAAVFPTSDGAAINVSYRF